MRQKFLLFSILFFLTTTVYFGIVIKKNNACANSISCINDLSTVVNNDEPGIFLGNPVTVPAINLALETFSSTVLGDTTSNQKEADSNTPSPSEKHIYIDLDKQTVYAFKGTEMYAQMLTSTGKWGRTPVGEYKIWVKVRSQKMSGGSGSTYYYLPNVPYVMFFYNNQVSKSRGYSLHGAYWHNNFGYEMSHGCINLREIDAKLLYDWASPTTINNTTHASKEDPGTTVSICAKIELRAGETPLCLD